MGSGSSIPDKIDQAAFEDLAGEVYPKYLFHRYCTSDGYIRKDDLLALSRQRDVYFSFDPIVSQVSHQRGLERLQRFNDMLRSKGILTYCHDFPNSNGESNNGAMTTPNKARGKLGAPSPKVASPFASRNNLLSDMQDSICSAIEQSQVILVGVTKSYIQKVEGINGKEVCKIEFGYSCRRKGFNKIIPIVLEEDCSNPSKWTGPVGLALRKHAAIQLTTDEGMAEKVEDVFQRIQRMVTPILLQTPLPPVKINTSISFESDLQHPTGIVPESSKSPTAMPLVVEFSESNPNNVEKFSRPPKLEVCLECPEYNQLKAWLIEHINLEEDKAHVLANKLISHGLQSPIRLKKKMELDSNYLAQLGFQRDEIGLIIHAFARQRKKSTKPLISEESFQKESSNNMLELEEDDDQTSITSSTRADICIPAYGCLRCSESIFRLPKGTFNTGWTCDWPTHEDENFFDADDALHGCGNILRCNVGVCKTCYDRIQAGKDTYVTIASVCCNRCGLGMFAYPVSFVEKYGIPWRCCSNYHVGNNELDTSVKLFACATAGACRFAMCGNCHLAEVKKVEEED